MQLWNLSHVHFEEVHNISIVYQRHWSYLKSHIWLKFFDIILNGVHLRKGMMIAHMIDMCERRVGDLEANCGGWKDVTTYPMEVYIWLAHRLYKTTWWFLSYQFKARQVEGIKV